MGQRFRARVETAGRGGYFITIGRRIAAQFGSRARLPVRGTVQGVPYRSSIFPREDGTFYMVLNRALREAGGITGGQVVQILRRPAGGASRKRCCRWPPADGSRAEPA